MDALQFPNKPLHFELASLVIGCAKNRWGVQSSKTERDRIPSI